MSDHDAKYDKIDHSLCAAHSSPSGALAGVSNCRMSEVVLATTVSQNRLKQNQRETKRDLYRLYIPRPAPGVNTRIVSIAIAEQSLRGIRKTACRR
jgi:hypothetical protein